MLTIVSNLLTTKGKIMKIHTSIQTERDNQSRQEMFDRYYLLNHGASDFCCNDTGKVSIKINLDDGGNYEQLELNQTALRQYCSRAKIPMSYAETLLIGNPDLLVLNLNQGRRQTTTNNPIVIKTHGEKLLSFMNNSYVHVKHSEAISLAETLASEFDLKINDISSDADSGNLIINTISNKKDLEIDVSTEREVGDIIQTGLRLTNNNIGDGGLTIKLYTYRLVCTNGMIAPSQGSEMKFNHTGRGLNIKVGNSYAKRMEYNDLNKADFTSLASKSYACASELLSGDHAERIRNKIINAQRLVIKFHDSEKLIKLVSREINLILNDYEVKIIAEKTAKASVRNSIDLWNLSNTFTDGAKYTSRRSTIEEKAFRILDLETRNIQYIEKALSVKSNIYKGRSSENYPIEETEGVII